MRPSPSYTPRHNRIDSQSMHMGGERIFDGQINRFHSSNVAISALGKETGSLEFVPIRFLQAR